MIQVDSENKNCTSTQFLLIQKNQSIELQEFLDRYCIVFFVSGLNSGKHDLNLMKNYLLPNLLNEGDIEPTVIEKWNQYMSFKIGDNLLLVIMNFPDRATSLDPSWNHT